MARRSRKDVTYLATAYRLHHSELADAVQSRNERLVEHGWLTSEHRLTADGKRLAEVALELHEHLELNLAIDTVGGLPKFVEIATAIPSDDGIDYFRGLMTLANRVDEAMNQAGTYDSEWDHDGTFTPFFMEFLPRNGRTEMLFGDVETAREFYNNWAPEYMDATLRDNEHAPTVEVEIV